ncbi:MAG: phosphoribosylformylglycinamidine synthase subunit PurQ [Candidatus Omnitrophica bacterium]|nr:phosphoribosylformylglycinamidine synthase subunit PurQ [Candidatus Omnitrophota bacterium]HOX54990.1 phosphoribosylformylglycinamidine synthase subunit PurQ [Candidatus Omnitrophota bacterium]
MKFGVVVFPGSNCDQDCFYVVKYVLKQQVRYIWHKDTQLNNYDCIILPGGFSYGDYLRTGAIARFSPVMKPLIDFAHKGKIVIGICNGFQILLEAGLIPGVMLRNNNLHFICKDVYIKTENTDTPFTNLYKHDQILKIPIAHNEGNYYIDNKGFNNLEANGQIVFRYCSIVGDTAGEFNPNGSIQNIAGIVNKSKNVLGMMPHPERSSEKLLGSLDGLNIFSSIVRWIKSH